MAIDSYRVHGHVVGESTGLPLSGVIVQWVAAGNNGGTDGNVGELLLLGGGRSGADGVVDLAESPSHDAQLAARGRVGSASRCAPALDEMGARACDAGWISAPG